MADSSTLEQLSKIIEEIQPILDRSKNKSKVEMSDLREIMRLVPSSVRHWVCCPKRLKMNPDQFSSELKGQIANSLGFRL